MYSKTYKKLELLVPTEREVYVTVLRLVIINIQSWKLYIVEVLLAFINVSVVGVEVC